MVSLMSLWLPILLSAVVVFLLSWLIHMLLPFHRGDFRKAPSEDEVMDSLRRLNIPNGDYMVPHPGSPQAMRSPEFQEKFKRGPVLTMTVMTGASSMGSSLIQWLLYCVVVSLFAAYLASRALAPGAPYLSVFRFAGTTAFVGYSLALWQNSIWYKQSWAKTLKYTIDGMIFGLFTGGMFGWLWPKM
jgi:hypothetical protein